MGVNYEIICHNETIFLVSSLVEAIIKKVDGYSQ